MKKRGYRVRMTSRTGSARSILGIWRKLVELRPASEEDGWLSLAQRPLWRVPYEMARWGWADEKSQDRKIVPLSPYVEKPLNSKVIKSFVPEQRSRKCFSCFEIPMFYLYEHSMYVSHIAISWLWYIITYPDQMRILYIYIYIYIYIYKQVWFGLVLWHINHCRLFNAKLIFIHINSSISKNLV